jgi:hypothetical protein
MDGADTCNLGDLFTIYLSSFISPWALPTILPLLQSKTRAILLTLASLDLTSFVVDYDFTAAFLAIHALVAVAKLTTWLGTCKGTGYLMGALNTIIGDVFVSLLGINFLREQNVQKPYDFVPPNWPSIFEIDTLKPYTQKCCLGPSIKCEWVIF